MGPSHRRDRYPPPRSPSIKKIDAVGGSMLEELLPEALPGHEPTRAAEPTYLLHRHPMPSEHTLTLKHRPAKHRCRATNSLLILFTIGWMCSLPVAAQDVGQVTLGANDCMTIGLAPADVTGTHPPSLPFYQPNVDETNIDQVVQSADQPVSNRFTVLDRWDTGSPPLIPIGSWDMGVYTGLENGAPWASSQRGHSDLFAYSGVQVAANRVGLWMNTTDPTTELYAGSNSLDIGCWYNEPPFARLFPSMDYDLDVSFDAGVESDLSIDTTSKTVTQAYFELILEDESGCYTNTAKTDRCKFTYQVGYYSRVPAYANIQQVHTDGTNTTSFPIAQTTVTSGRTSDNALPWLHDASIDFQSQPFAPRSVHFRVSPNDFINVLNALISSGQPGYQQLSKNPLDYRITLIGINGEIAPSLNGYGRLGMSVSKARVSTVIPHQVSGSPAAFNDPDPQLVYRDDTKIYLLSTDLRGSPNTKTLLSQEGAAGDPEGYFGNNASRVVYRDSNRHILEAFKQDGAWSKWDMTSSLGLASTGSDPKPYVDADESSHVIYRDLVGNVHQLSLGSNGWRDTNLSSVSLPSTPEAAMGSPMGYLANGVPRIVYRDINNQVVELYFYNGNWNHWQMTSLDGSAPAYSDPQGYLDSSGYPHVVYRDIVGDIHDFGMDSNGWHHTNVTSITGASPALGNPKGVVTGGATRIIYRGTDNDLHELVRWMNSWIHNDLSQTRGALPLTSDPVEFTGSDGVTRIEYVSLDDQLHEFYYSSGWLHRDI